MCHRIETSTDGGRATVLPAADLYRSLSEHSLNGLALLEVVLDAQGRPVDAVFLEVNPAFEEQMGVRREAVVGRRASEALPGIQCDTADWIGRYARVALTGEAIRFQDVSEAAQRWYEVSAFSPARGYFAVAFSDVTEHKRLEDALREADRRKTEFLGLLSHELRNPLAPVRIALSLLDRTLPRSGQAARVKQVIDRQVEHLCRIVDDLLDVTRVTHGKFALQRTRADLVALVARSIEDHRPLFAARHVRLEERLGDEPVWLDADVTRISQAVGNLLQNAAKFTRRDGRVEVAVEREPPGTAVIRVRDDGVGIDPALLERIFEPFTQADESLHRSRGGLGLGLALVKGVVELHGGSVVAQSEGRGRGAEFVVRLPTAADGAPAPRAAPGAAAPPRRVLVVEDHLDAAETLGELLRAWHHEVAIAHDGREGLEKARAFRPDVVLCDLGLPVIDGYEVAREIRTDPALAPAFLVALTGYALAEDERRASEAGFDRHLAKPVSAEQLQEVLRETGPRAAT
jgi:two-component system CheB/CheR fusion protein